MALTVRPIEPTDVEVCGRIGHEAHQAIALAHDYPSEQPTEEYGIGIIRSCLSNKNSWGVLAEKEGKVLGSIFLHRFPPSPIAVIGPLTVHPSAEGGVGRTLMRAALDQAQRQGQDQIRLVQSPSHIRSFVLYSRCGFVLREPLFLIQGQPSTAGSGSSNVHPLTNEDDISGCNELCRKVHGFSREGELRQAVNQGVASIVETKGEISGYAAGIGLFGHAVAKTNEDLKALVSSSKKIVEPGFFVPSRNHELLNWLLDNGLKIAWPANLMTIGAYQESHLPFLPSLAY